MGWKVPKESGLARELWGLNMSLEVREAPLWRVASTIPLVHDGSLMDYNVPIILKNHRGAAPSGGAQCSNILLPITSGIRRHLKF